AGPSGSPGSWCWDTLLGQDLHLVGGSFADLGGRPTSTRFVSAAGDGREPGEFPRKQKAKLFRIMYISREKSRTFQGKSTFFCAEQVRCPGGGCLPRSGGSCRPLR